MSKNSEAFRAAVLWELLFNVKLYDYDPHAAVETSEAKRIAALSSKSEAALAEEEIWELIQSDVEESGAFIKSHEGMLAWLTEKGIKIPKSKVQAIARVAASKRGWHCGRTTDKIAEKSGQGKNVWYVATSPYSHLEHNVRHVALGLGKEKTRKF